MVEKYIDRDLSNSIKGILILLIVFGHNHVLCPNNEAFGLMDYLYKFHVIGFFILPFFYNTEKSCSKDQIITIFIRCIIPYIWICFLCFLCNSIYTRTLNISISSLYALMQGTQTPLREAFGFVFPWFLPAYCSFSIMLLFARKYKTMWWGITIFSVITWFWSWNTFYIFKNVAPFGTGLAISYFGAGCLCFYLNNISEWFKYVSIFVFAILTVGYWDSWQLGFLYKLFPVFFFSAILLVSPYLQCRLLQNLGRNSLGIYLFHMFIVNITYMIFPKTIVWGIVGFILSLLISLFITQFIMSKSFLRKLLFPRSLMDVKSVFK